MPRNMSFMLTTSQIINQTKTVTRRLGWKFLKPGDVLNACVKCQGLKQGEKIQRLCQIRVKDVRRELLSEMVPPKNYGMAEAYREGFPNLTGAEFVGMFCENMRCEPDTEVTRIAFEYINEKAKEAQ